jgi:hypothetical protein
MTIIFTASFRLILSMLLASVTVLDTRAQKILDHEVVLDQEDRLLPWTSYDNIIRWSMAFLINCPTQKTRFGEDPLYLITAKLNEDGTFRLKQNNQGSNVYWAMETARKYYAYSGEKAAFEPAKRLIDRIIFYHTPSDWAWPDVPRTQDDTPDGEYTDEWSGVDKICMTALGYINYYKFSGERKYLDRAVEVTRTIIKQVESGSEDRSPLPFRVNLRTGEIIDSYTANMIPAIQLFDAIITLSLKQLNLDVVSEKRHIIWEWIKSYPLKNNRWSGYYEDVSSKVNNYNQQIPMETARYLLNNPQSDPKFKEHVPALIHWVRARFTKSRYYGAASICEQDSFRKEMSSHTARYASVVAMWYEISRSEKDLEEARAAFALSIYSAYNKYSKNGISINYVGIEYSKPWFSDSYWDYLSHFFDGMTALTAMLPADQNHLFYSSSIITAINYSEKKIEYEVFDTSGTEKIKIQFDPQVYADNKRLANSEWQLDKASSILTINRQNTKHILIVEK